jgi:hypothetical protein
MKSRGNAFQEYLSGLGSPAPDRCTWEIVWSVVLPRWLTLRPFPEYLESLASPMRSIDAYEGSMVVITHKVLIVVGILIFDFNRLSYGNCWLNHLYSK